MSTIELTNEFLNRSVFLREPGLAPYGLVCEEFRSAAAMSSFDDVLQSEQAKRQKRALAMTPEERLERFVALQAAAESLLASNPAALEAFHRRNRQQRRESRVRQLESQWRIVAVRDIE